MEVINSVNDVTSSTLLIYYLFVCTFLGYAFKKYGINRHVVITVVLFTFGLFGFIEYQIGFTSNIYKIVLTILLALVCGKSLLRVDSSKNLFIYGIYTLFSISYFLTHYANNQLNISVVSQYILTYSFPFIIYQGYKNISTVTNKRDIVLKSISYLILVQVLLSIVKMGLLGGVMESIVGSIQFIGGGTAVSLPIIGLLFLWAIRSGNFERKDWIIALSFLLIAIASAKRTPIFVFPIFLILLFSFANRGKSIINLAYYTPLFFLLLYVGVRLNYTLNPEGVIWGSFDLEYLYNYVMRYNFGTTDLTEATKFTSGRGGALFLLTQPEALGLMDTWDVLFGNGVTEVVREQSGRFVGGISYGIEHRGLMGAAVMEIYKLGMLGFGLYLLFISFLVNQIRNNKFKWIIALWLFVDVFLYYGTTLFHPSISFLFVIILLMSSKK